MRGKLSGVLLFAIVLAMVQTPITPASAISNKTIEVSQPVQITHSGYYERGQSIIFDGTNYWLFYGRSASCTDVYQTGNPDIYDYTLFYKKAASVAGLVSANATAVTNYSVPPAGFYNGETGAAHHDGKVWAFAPIEDPEHADRADVYGWHTADGDSWTAVGPFWGNKLRGSLHHDEISFGGELWIVEGAADGDVTTRHGDPYDPTTQAWADSQLGLNLGSSGGIMHFFVDNGELYLAGLQVSPRNNVVYRYNAADDAWDEVASTASEGWDPTLFRLGSNYLFVQAPWESSDDGGRQYMVAWSGDTLGEAFFDRAGDPVPVTGGRYADNTWVDMWPIGFTDQDGNSYLFFTSERNPDDSSSEIAGNIWYLPFTWDAGSHHYTYIQEAVNAAAPGDTINVAPGNYVEAITVDKPLTLRGATCSVNKNDCSVPDDYAWDATVESIITHPDPAGGYLSIVDIYDVGDVTLEGFVIQELNAQANLNSSLVRVRAQTRQLDNIVIRNNIIGPNTRAASQDGTHGRMGLYLVNNPYSDQYGIVDSTIAGNKIFGCEGNGNNVFIWSSYLGYGAAGPASMSGTVIEDNEICGSHRSGIETAGGFSGLTIRNNSIHGNFKLEGDNPALKYGNGILMIRGSGDRENTNGYGPESVTIEDNEIYNNGGHGLYLGPNNEAISITNNSFYNNGEAAVMVDLVGNYWNPDFETYAGPYTNLSGSLDISASRNEVRDNGTGMAVNGEPANGFVLNAAGNWWGTAESTAVAATVSGAVEYDPWYADAAMTTLASGKPVRNVTHEGYYDTVQEAIDAASNGDIITIMAGTYDETIDIDKRITLQGAGSSTAGTVLKSVTSPDAVAGLTYGSYKPVVILSASGSEASPITLKDLLITPQHDVVAGGQLAGILPRPGTQVSHVMLDNVRITGTRAEGTFESGIAVDGSAGLDHLTVQNCRFEDMAYGMIIYTASGTAWTAENIEISDTTFDGNSIKGFYAEKLSDAVFIDVSITDNGDTSLSPDWADPSNAGIDINLKYGEYQNIVFNNLTVSGNGAGSENGAGLTVKARGSGEDTSYSTDPASLTGVTVNGGVFTGNEAGIYFGEPDKNNTEPEEITVSNARIYGNTRLGLANLTSGVTVDAENCWWGTTDGAAVAATVSGAVDYDPWHLKQIGDLTTSHTDLNSTVLSWTTVGTWDGDSLDIRYATEAITPQNWDSARRVSGEPAPANDTVQKMMIRGLSSDTTYYFGLKAVSGNDSSGISTTSATTPALAPVDVTAPAAITTLATAAGSPATTKAVLSWQATGDDGNEGFATGYIIKRSSAAITAENFEAATTIYNSLSPAASGSGETFNVKKLSPGTTYYFAVKAQDEANNTSAISNVVSITTADVLPTVSDITPATGDNGEARTITVTGGNFISSGTTVVRLASAADTFALTNVSYVSASELTAVVPAGVPAGTYRARVINDNGTSEPSDGTYTVTEAPVPLPVVTNVIPQLATSGTTVSGVRISGKNLTGATAAAIDGTAATGISVDSDTRIIIDIPGLAAGEYDIKVTTPAGTNDVSTVKFSVANPVVVGADATEDTTTSGVIDLDTNVTPVQITLTTDDSETATQNTDADAEISVVIPPNTTLTDENGDAYTGEINPPRVVKPDESVHTDLPEEAVVIEMGNPEETISFNQDFVATVTVNAADEPDIYYYNKTSGEYELAGKAGSRDGVDYAAGGTVLGQENGTYIIGLLLDHMSTYIASVESLIETPVTPPTGGESVALPRKATTPEEPPPGTTDIRGMVSTTGVFTSEVTMTSDDGLAKLTLPEGTVGLTEDLEPLTEIKIQTVKEPPPPPEGGSIIGAVYDLGPDGATFDPPASMVWSYDHQALPADTAEETLVIAFYDEAASAWEHCQCSCNPDENCVNACVCHFTTFAIISVPLPADFSTGQPVLSPAEVAPGEAVNIGFMVTNTGSTEGSYEAVLQINGAAEASQRITLAAGSSEMVFFSVSRNEAGSYLIDINGMTAEFTVTPPPEPEQTMSAESPPQPTAEPLPPEPAAPGEPSAAPDNRFNLLIILAATVTVIIIALLIRGIRRLRR